MKQPPVFIHAALTALSMCAAAVVAAAWEARAPLELRATVAAGLAGLAVFAAGLYDLSNRHPKDN